MISTNEIILASVFIAVGAALSPLAAYFLKWIGFYIYGEKDETQIIIKKGTRKIEFSSSINDEELDALILQLKKL